MAEAIPVIDLSDDTVAIPLTESALLNRFLEDNDSIVALDRSQIKNLAMQLGVPEIYLREYQQARIFISQPEATTPEEMRAALIARQGGDTEEPIGDGKRAHISEFPEAILKRTYQNHRKWDPKKVLKCLDDRYLNQ
tara:strand:- start:590 stop:1000 length:411 start_codon:yes stop_codon:yes gene_type:complete